MTENTNSKFPKEADVVIVGKGSLYDPKNEKVRT